MPLSAATTRLDPTDWLTVTRTPEGSVCLAYPGHTIEFPPEQVATLFAGLLAVMTPTGGAEIVRLHTKPHAAPTAILLDDDGQPIRPDAALCRLFGGDLVPAFRDLPSDTQPENERA